MKGRLIISAAFALTLAGPAVAAPDAQRIERDAKALCSANYPDDFTMQGACIRNARRGAASFAEIENQHRGDPAWVRALARCVSGYTERGHTDWSMAGACARNQQRGWEEAR